MNIKKKLNCVCASCGRRFHTSVIASRVKCISIYGLCDECYKRLLIEIDARSFAAMVPQGTK